MRETFEQTISKSKKALWKNKIILDGRVGAEAGIDSIRSYPVGNGKAGEELIHINFI